MTVWQPHHYQKVTGGFIQMKNEIKNLAHSSYRCQYHIVFVPDVFCKLSAEGHLHLVCWNPIQEFLFNGCKEAFHSGRYQNSDLHRWDSEEPPRYWASREMFRLCTGFLDHYAELLRLTEIFWPRHWMYQYTVPCAYCFALPEKLSLHWSHPFAFMILDIRRLPAV